MRSSFKINENYWEQDNSQKSRHKKKVTFDDILTNMNLVVNTQGVLQYMSANSNTNTNTPSDFSTYQQNKTNEPIEPAVKHSYIYNKYFKNYASQSSNEPVYIAPRIPKTMEEYKRMLLDDRIKAMERKRQLEQIYSKKMMFTTSRNGKMNIQNVQKKNNNLGNMNFH